MITKPKGTIDLYGMEAKKWQYVNNVIVSLCEKYNYNFIRTPIFEVSELFHRGVGDTTDIVTKETYDFIDRGARNITLRPEGTASVVRSYLENKMYGEANQPVKLYYNGTMYRYERPQSGRNREFTQFGVEIIGTDDPYSDAEVISIPVEFYKMLGLKGIKVKINSLGDTASRNQYREVLIDYLRPNIDKLCPDCQQRYLKNPLRILDCKYDQENEIIKNAPQIIDYLNEESLKRFELVQNYLDILEVDYEIDPNIIRGLDYYNHTVFEIIADIKDFGSQNALAAGGRYNDLVKNLGGGDTPGVGFAMGIDRLMLALEKEDIKLDITDEIDIFLMYVSAAEKSKAIELVRLLRMNGFIADLDYLGRNLKGQFKQGDRLNTKYFIILNDEDIKNRVIQVKDNLTKEETKIQESELIDFLDLNL